MTALLHRPTADSLWRNRDFNLLWTGQAMSSLGGSMAFLAYPLVVLALTGSPVVAGVVGTIGAAVGAAVMMPAGVVVDRVDRRRLMIWCDVVRLIAFAALGLALLTGHASVALVVAVVVVEAICEAPYFSAAMTAVRNLVPGGQIKEAMARNEARQYAVNLVGPPIGGLLFSAGRALPFLANVVCYLGSLATLLAIRRPLQERTEEAETPQAGWLHDLTEGLKYVVTDPFVRAAVLIAAPLNLALNAMLFGIVLLLREHGVTPALIGVAETIFGVGGLLGAVSAAALLRRVSVPWLLRAVCVAGVPVLLAVIPLSRSPLAAIPIAVLALLFPALNAGLFGHLAAVVDDRIQGRVVSALMFAAMGLASLAPLVAGLLVHSSGAPGLAVGCAALMAVSAVVALTSRGIGQITDQDAHQGVGGVQHQPPA